MNNELAKTISTCAIWLSVACILTFGIFKMNANVRVSRCSQPVSGS